MAEVIDICESAERTVQQVGDDITITVTNLPPGGDKKTTKTDQVENHDGQSKQSTEDLNGRNEVSENSNRPSWTYNEMIDTRKLKICTFYQRNGACKFREGCRFLHKSVEESMSINFETAKKSSNTKICESSKSQVADDVDKIESLQNLSDTVGDSEYNTSMATNIGQLEDNILSIQAVKGKVCKFFILQRGCKFGDECPFVHYRSVSDAAEESSCENVSKNDIKVIIRESELEHNTDIFAHNNDNIKIMAASEEKKQTDLEMHDNLKCEDGKADKDKNINIHVNKIKARNRKCKFFLSSRRGCKLKDKCPFDHDNRKIRNDENCIEKNGKYTKERKMKDKDKDLDLGLTNSNIITDDSKVRNYNSEHTDTEPNHTFRSEKNVKINQPGKCRFFFSPKGCRMNAAECSFSHEEEIVSTKTNNTMNKEQNHLNNASGEQMKLSSKNGEHAHILNQNENMGLAGSRNSTSVKYINEKEYRKARKREVIEVCKFHKMRRGCLKGNNCNFVHTSLNDGEKNGNVDSKLSGNRHLKLQQTEFTQLERRFAANKFVLIQKEPSAIYSVTVEPSDSDWPFVVTQFTIQIDFPADYPKQLFTVFLADNEKFPPGFSDFMNDGLLKWCMERKQQRDDKDLAFRPFLKWFDRNLKDLFSEAATKVKLQQEAQKAGITFVPHQTILSKSNVTKSDSQINSKQDEDDHVTATNVLMNDSAQNGVQSNCDDKENRLSEKVKKGTEVKFSHLVLSENIGTLKLRNLLLTVQCNRCKTRMDVKLQEKQSVSMSCKKCHTNYTLVFYSEFVHHYSPVAGYLHMQGCKAFDLVLVESVVILNCLNCYKDSEIKGMAYGAKRDHWCYSCHVKMDIELQATKFVELSPGGAAAVKQKEKGVVKKKTVKDPSIKEGEPLPDSGCCKHYKKSYRWLRFPCCGKAYPCDICHEEKEENDHEMKVATRMICGFCSKEQPFTKDRPCISCQANVTKTYSSHWEGGKGCRDKTKMARDDKQKTAGAGKTISRKKAAEQDKKKK